MNLPPPILADSEDVIKIVFFVIFFFIWVISAFVSWVNKKQQEVKRRRMLEEADRASRYGQGPPRRSPLPAVPLPPPPPPVPARPPQRIAEGLAQRFPDVLLPPAPPPPPRPAPARVPPHYPQQQQHPQYRPPPPPQQRHPQPRPQVRAVSPQRPQARPQQAKRTPKQPVRAVPLPPPPLVELEETTTSHIAAQAVQTATRTQRPTVDAAAIAKWMTPATLRQQFILTEILQPPLALRPDPRD